MPLKEDDGFAGSNETAFVARFHFQDSPDRCHIYAERRRSLCKVIVRKAESGERERVLILQQVPCALSHDAVSIKPSGFLETSYGCICFAVECSCNANLVAPFTEELLQLFHILAG